MGLSAAGLAAGYAGYAAAERQSKEDDRLAKAAARADADAAFQEETRARQRDDWKEQDRKKADDKADVEAANLKFDGPPGAGANAVQKQAQAAVREAFEAPEGVSAGAVEQPPAPAKLDSVVTAATPSWANSAKASGKQVLDLEQQPLDMGKAGGMPKPNDFNNTLAKAAYRLQRKADRNDLSAEEYARGSAFLDQMKRQGITDALELMSQGRYDEALDKYNSTGSMSGARVVSGEEGSTKINGQDTPTHFVVIQNKDGSRTTMDVAKARYQLMSMSEQLGHQDRSKQLSMQAEQVQLSRDQLTQHTKDAAAARGIQLQGLRLQQQQFEASTPLGQITAMGKALGRPLTGDEIENRLGLSRIPRAVEMQVASLMKENDTDTQAMAKAVASPEGINPAAAATFQKNAAIRNERLRQLLTPYSGGGRGAASPALSDPLNLRQQSGAPSGGVTVPNPMPPDGADGAGQNTGVRAALAGKVAERDARMAQFNRTVGGANQSRSTALAQRADDVAQNFDANLAAIKPGMSRDEQQRVLSWMAQQADAGLLSNEQLRQVRIARSNARM